MDTLAKFDRPEAEVVVSDANDKVVFRRQVKLDAFGSVQASFPVPATAALGNYAIRIQSGESQGLGGFEVQEYRKPEFEVIVTPASRFVVQGREAVVDVQARYYFGQPVSNGNVRWVVNQQPYFSRCDGMTMSKARTAATGTAITRPRRARFDSTRPARRRSGFRSASTTTPATSARASSAGHRCRQSRGCRPHDRHATYGTFFLSAEAGNTIHRGGEQVQVSIRALDYLGTAQPNVPVTLALEHLQYRAGYYAQPEVTSLATQNAATDADGRALVTLRCRTAAAASASRDGAECRAHGAG
jgi:hypothetical protein